MNEAHELFFAVLKAARRNPDAGLLLNYGKVVGMQKCLRERKDILDVAANTEDYWKHLSSGAEK